jgi:hypothetical protein
MEAAPEIRTVRKQRHSDEYIATGCIFEFNVYFLFRLKGDGSILIFRGIVWIFVHFKYLA